MVEDTPLCLIASFFSLDWKKKRTGRPMWRRGPIGDMEECEAGISSGKGWGAFWHGAPKVKRSWERKVCNPEMRLALSVLPCATAKPNVPESSAANCTLLNPLWESWLSFLESKGWIRISGSGQAGLGERSFSATKRFNQNNAELGSDGNWVCFQPIQTVGH